MADSDGQVLMKVVLVISLVMLLVSSIFPGANAAWTNLNATLTAGPQFPQLFNPFNAITGYATLFPVANGSIKPDFVHNCDGTHWYKCIQPGRGSGSRWVFLNGTAMGGWPPTPGTNGINMSFKLGSNDGASASAKVLTAQIILGCNSTYAGPERPVPTFFSANPDGLTSPSFNVGTPQCNYDPAGGLASDTTFVNDTTMAQSLGLTFGDFMGHYVNLASFVGSNFFIHSFVVVLGLSWQEICPNPVVAWDFSGIVCQIRQFVLGVLNFLLLMGSIIAFAIFFVVAIVGFVVSLLVGVFIGLALTMFYFFSIPGTPPVVQAIIDALMIVLLIFAFYMITKIVVALTGAAADKV